MKTHYVKLKTFLLFTALIVSSFLSAQTTLKELAEQKGKYIGNIMSSEVLNSASTGYNYDGNNPNNILRGEFNTIVLENDMKMEYVLPDNEPNNIHNLTKNQLKALLKTTAINNFMGYTNWSNPAQGFDQLRDRGHAMVWYNQAPGWLDNNNWSTQQLYDFTEKYIHALVELTNNEIAEWDVFNEAFVDDQGQGDNGWRPDTWYSQVQYGTYNGQQSSYQLFFEKCFEWARAAVGDDVMLMYNDYSIENKGYHKSDFMYSVISQAVTNNASINGVGFQSHLSVYGVNTTFVQNVVDRIDELGALGNGLKVHITELDIHSDNSNHDDQDIQNAYWLYVSETLKEPNVDELLIWGISDKDSWITKITNPNEYFGDKTGFLLWDGNWDKNENPGAYQGVWDALSTLDAKSFPPAGLEENWTEHGNHQGSGTTDDIVSVNSPSSVTPGSNVTIAVEYSATQNRDILVYFQKDSPGWNQYGLARLPVSSGAGTVNLTIPISGNTPQANNEYQFQVLIVPTGGGWGSHFDNLANANVDAVVPTADDVISVNSPSSVTPGSNANITVAYSATQNRDILVYFQKDSPGWNEYGRVRQPVSAGVGTLNLSVPIGGGTPQANNAYQFQVLIVPPGGEWGSHFDNIANANVDAGNGANNRLIQEEDQVVTSSILLYPNPAFDVLNISGNLAGEVDVRIFGSASNLLINKKMILAEGSSASVDVSDLAPGLYLISFIQNGHKYLKRFIKQ